MSSSIQFMDVAGHCVHYSRSFAPGSRGQLLMGDEMKRTAGSSRASLMQRDSSPGHLESVLEIGQGFRVHRNDSQRGDVSGDGRSC